MRISGWSAGVLGLSLVAYGCTSRTIFEDGTTESDPTAGSDDDPDGGPGPNTEPTPATCGNGLVDGTERCDGNDLMGQSCASLGFPGGTLACLPNCQDFDLTGCDPPAACGNGVVEPPELCDGSDLAGQTCAAQGLPDGELRCGGDCLSFDPLGCGTACQDSDLGEAVGPAVASGNTQSDDDDLPQSCANQGSRDHVMGFLASAPGSYRFDTFGSGYDTALAIFGSCHPASELACNDDAQDLQSQVTVPLNAGQRVFVVVDGYGDDFGPWVLNITPPSIPPAPSCVEEDLLWFLGSPITLGSTQGEDEDLPQSCANGGAVDHVMRFIAPYSGGFVFDTFGSTYDTALSLHSGCEPGSELACNDDEGDGVQSQVYRELMAGEQILVVVSGYSGDVGNWQLNVTGS